MVGCGGDTNSTVKKTETKVQTPSGTKTETKKEETKTTDTTKKP